jgi:hypothetical protein
VPYPETGLLPGRGTQIDQICTAADLYLTLTWEPRRLGGYACGGRRPSPCQRQGLRGARLHIYTSQPDAPMRAHAAPRVFAWQLTGSSKLTGIVLLSGHRSRFLCGYVS